MDYVASYPETRFDCTYCELCCRLIDVPLSKLDRKTLGKHSRKIRLRDQKCPHLCEDSSCGIHEKKPYACAMFPFEIHPRIDGVLVIELNHACPGIGKGKKITKNFEKKLIHETLKHHEQQIKKTQDFLKQMYLKKPLLGNVDETTRQINTLVEKVVSKNQETSHIYSVLQYLGYLEKHLALKKKTKIEIPLLPVPGVDKENLEYYELCFYDPKRKKTVKKTIKKTETGYQLGKKHYGFKQIRGVKLDCPKALVGYLRELTRRSKTSKLVYQHIKEEKENVYQAYAAFFLNTQRFINTVARLVALQDGKKTVDEKTMEKTIKVLEHNKHDIIP